MATTALLCELDCTDPPKDPAATHSTFHCHSCFSCFLAASRCHGRTLLRRPPLASYGAPRRRHGGRPRTACTPSTARGAAPLKASPLVTSELSTTALQLPLPVVPAPVQAIHAAEQTRRDTLAAQRQASAVQCQYAITLCDGLHPPKDLAATTARFKPTPERPLRDLDPT
jgi:hypothetical protein